MFQARAKIIKIIEVTQKYYKIVLSCPEIARSAKPGQFIQAKVSDMYEPLLRRPFSIHRVNGPSIEILFEVVGQGSKILSQRKRGGYLDIIGPLGNGFNYSQQATRNALPILVAGGMGVAPLAFLAQEMHTKTQRHKDTRRPLVLIGARTKSQILCDKEFKALGYDVKIATDDGSRGFKGRVTELLKAIIDTRHKTQDTSKNKKRPDTIIYACGPRPMLEAISEISKKYNIPAQISLEEHMACGIGACLGCVVKTRGENSNASYLVRRTPYEYKRVCKDGPVFVTDKIIWE